MNILYCGDGNIADGLIISVLSLTKHIDEPLNIFILTMGLETETRVYRPLPQRVVNAVEDIIKAKNPQSTVCCTDIGELFEKEPPQANLGTRFTPFCMLRLFADSVPHLPQRLLYLDNDVICRGDFTDFYRQDMDGCELAGVLDHYGRWFFRKNLFKMDYLNSGVLLLDLERIKQTGLFEKSRLMCRTKKMFMPDQSALNKLALGKKQCPRRFNEQRRLQKDTVFQHFTTSFRFFPYIRTVTVKPWQIDRMHEVLKLHEYDDLLEEYKAVKEKILAVQ